MYKKNISDSICFLSLGVKLINNSLSFFQSPETFFLCGEIFLFLSSLLIANENYDTAKNMINLSCIFLYISLESLLFSNPKQISYSIFNLLNQEKQNYDYIKKIIFYLSISFYHLGICYEDEGYPYDSYYAYKQSKFFSSIFEEKNEDINKLYEYIKGIEKRQLMRNRIIIFFERNVKKEDLIDIPIPIKEEYNEYFSNKEKREKKFLMLENHISNMKLIEVDNDEPHLFDKINKHFSYKINLVTKKIHLLDYLMSDNFRQTINNMKKIKINKLNKETIDVIQKKIINIKNNEREKIRIKFKKDKNKNDEKDKENEINCGNQKIIKEKENLDFKTLKNISSEKTLNSGKKTRISSQALLTDNNNYSRKSESFFSFNSRPTTAQNNLTYRTRLQSKGYFSLKSFWNRNNFLSNEKTYNKTNDKIKDIIENKKKFKLSTSPNTIDNERYKYRIPKYSYDKYIYNKSFIKKKKILENQYTKELLFQKQLLKLKHCENMKTEFQNIKDVKKNCEKFYYTTFTRELMNARDGNIILNKNDNNLKRKEKNNKIFFSPQKTKELTDSSYFNYKNESKYKTPYKNNNEYIDSLFRDIVYLNEKEKKIK